MANKVTFDKGLLLRLAAAGATARLSAIDQELGGLQAERAEVLAAFPGLEDGSATPGDGVATVTKKRGMPKAARLAISKRMKAYWRGRRKER